jgi:hypothetical protein
MFVRDAYDGFDIEESKSRSDAWGKLGLDKSRIGKQSYWLKTLQEHGF